MNQSIYERLIQLGVSHEFAVKSATPPPGAEIPCWGIYYQNGWPDVSMFACHDGRDDKTWEQAYNRVLDLRAVSAVMAS